MNRLREHAPISRAGLAEITGLNKSTVSSLVNELIHRQFVREVGMMSAGTGRPPILLELNPKAGHIISCEIGVDFISVICSNFGAQVVWRQRETTHDLNNQQSIIERCIALLHEAIKAGPDTCGGCGNLLGIAVGVPGLVNLQDGMLLFGPNLGWRDVPLHAILSSVFKNVPLFVNNEANMAALGEYFFGAGQGYDEILYISDGVGLGGAFVRHGQVLEGSAGFASEFGHMTMNPDGEPCNCGNRGCWETQVSQAALFRAIRHAVEQGHPTQLIEQSGGNLDLLSVAMVMQAANEGDPVACAALSAVGHYLGIGIASLVNAFNPDLILFGGSLSAAGDYLLPIIEAEIHARALRWNASTTQLTVAQHGTDACVMGGVAIVYQATLTQPSHLSHLAV